MRSSDLFIGKIEIRIKRCVVGGAVVDENELIVGVCLLQNTFDTSLQVASYFVNGDYDA